MSDAENPAIDPMLGTALDDAVEAVLDREEGADRESVRSALELVATDGTVSRDGIDSALGEAAQYVATPENRLELAGAALDEARAAAEPAADLGVVRSRLDGFETRYRNLDGDVDELLDRLDALVDRSDRPNDVYDLARGIEDLKWDVRDAHGDAETLREDLEAFETWVNDPDARFDELGDDVDHLAGLLDGLDAAVEDLEAGATDDELDSAVVWAEAALQRRVANLLVADLRAELSDLRNWPGDAGQADTERANELEARIEDLRARESALTERLDDAARDGWRERFADRIDAFEDDLDEFEPPVPWGAIQDTLVEHRSALGDEGDVDA